MTSFHIHMLMLRIITLSLFRFYQLLSLSSLPLPLPLPPLSLSCLPRLPLFITYIMSYNSDLFWNRAEWWASHTKITEANLYVYVYLTHQTIAVWVARERLLSKKTCCYWLQGLWHVLLILSKAIKGTFSFINRNRLAAHLMLLFWPQREELLQKNKMQLWTKFYCTWWSYIRQTLWVVLLVLLNKYSITTHLKLYFWPQGKHYSRRTKCRWTKVTWSSNYT